MSTVITKIAFIIAGDNGPWDKDGMRTICLCVIDSQAVHAFGQLRSHGYE